MKRVAVVVIDDKETELQSLREAKRTEIINRLNRRALESRGYRVKKV